MRKLKLISLIACFFVIFVSFTFALTESTSRISTDSSGNQTSGGPTGNYVFYYYPDISETGKYVAFKSFASDLVPNDTNNYYDFFLKDTQTGSTTRISTDSSGNQGNHTNDDNSPYPSISANGRYVAFASGATNLVANDTNGKQDIFLKDTQTGNTTRISTDSSGNEANDISSRPSISDDGTRIAFGSTASNLVSGDTNSGDDVFVKDTQTGSTTRVSVDASGNQSSHFNPDYPGFPSSSYPVISGNGRFVVFWSSATNFDNNNDGTDMFIKDTQAGSLNKVNTNSDGDRIANFGFFAHQSVSDDGRYIVFDSTSSNAVSNDTNSESDIFMKDTQTGKTIRISEDSDGKEQNGSGSDGSYFPSISDNGRYVVFVSRVQNFTYPKVFNPLITIFVKDTTTNKLRRVSFSNDGYEANSSSEFPDISGNGKYIVYNSDATNLVENDTNQLKDLFISKIDKSNPKTYAPQKTIVENFNSRSSVKSALKKTNAKLYWKVSDSDLNKSGDQAYVVIKIKKRIGKSAIRERYYKLYKAYQSKAAKTKNKKLKKQYHKKARQYKNKWKKEDPYKYKLVDKILLGWTTINKARFYNWKVSKTGIYKYYIYAADAAGNEQKNIASNYVIVKT